jgi:heme-degrading monooxygenase HmoA
MPYVLVRHKIADYEKWRKVFDGKDNILQGSGVQGGMLFRNIDKPDEIIVLLRWKTLDTLRDFMASDRLRQAMQKGGVADQPDVYFLDELEKPRV